MRRRTSQVNSRAAAAAKPNNTYAAVAARTNKPQPHLNVEAQPLGCAAECLPQRRDAVCPSEGDGEAWSTQHLTHRPMRKQRPASAAVAVCTATAWLQSPTGEEPACRCHPRVRRSCRAARCAAVLAAAAAAARRGRQRRLGGSRGGALKLRLEDAARQGGRGKAER